MFQKYLKSRVTALQSFLAVIASIIWLSWSLGKKGHTETWNVAFVAFLTSVVVSYMTSRRARVQEAKNANDNGAG